MKVYLVCWTTSAVSEPEYYVEKAFAKKEDAERFIVKTPALEGSYYIAGSDLDNGWWIEELEVE